MSHHIDRFTLGLGLMVPWRVASSDFTLDAGGLRLVIEGGAGVVLPCPHSVRCGDA